MGPYYIEKIEALRNGKWNTGEAPDHWAGNKWGGFSTEMLELSEFKNMPEDVIKKAEEVMNKIKSGKLKIFAGPLIDNNGKEILPAGKEMDDGGLWGMNYYLQGVDGKIPG